MANPRETMEHNLSTILVGTDLGDEARSALEAAVHLRPPGAGSLHVVHAVPRPDTETAASLRNAGPQEGDGAVGEFGRSRHLAALERHLSGIGSALGRPRLHVRQGRPHRVIRQVAAEVEADLVVLGGHRPRRPFDGLLGSTGERVVRTSRVPCLLVNRAITAVPRRLMVATDLSAHAERAMQVAVAWGRQWAEIHHRDGPGGRGIALDLVNISDFARPGYRPMANSDRLARLAAEASERGGVAVTVRHRIASHPLAPEGILAVALELEPDLVFLGTHGSGPFLRALFGSITSEVIRTLPLAVVVVPPPSPARAPR
jgi:nucleotide-binding universal stress UspA family protein